MFIASTVQDEGVKAPLEGNGLYGDVVEMCVIVANDSHLMVHCFSWMKMCEIEGATSE